MLKRWRIKRYKIRAWNNYHRAVRNERLLESYGLGYPDRVPAPEFEDPRKLA